MSEAEIKAKCIGWERSGMIVMREVVKKEGFILEQQESLTSLIYKLLVIDYGQEVVNAALLSGKQRF